jgi:AraC family transcriptional regulator
MTPSEKALWFIESHFAQDITLDDIAAAAGVSRYHAIRAFDAATDLSVMRYVRARRLAEAAKTLAGGAPDILAVALEAGYGSHEAFTRAFGDAFGTTPEAVRATGTTRELQLMEPIKMNEAPIANLQPPRFVDGRALTIAGLSLPMAEDPGAAIPALWQRFGAYIGNIPGQVGRVAYGVLRRNDETGAVDYIAGVEVSGTDDLPAEFTIVDIAARHYAAFSQPEHISAIRGVWMAIWNRWLPGSGYEAVRAPDFERYPECFDPRTGNGGFEIWLPVKRR